MKQTLVSIVLVIVATGCRGGGVQVTPAAAPGAVQLHGSPSPYAEVTAGPVHALIPDDWRTVATSPEGVSRGFYASPHPNAWTRGDGSVEGISATWIDATRVGVPSDFYYLAASGPVVSRLTHSAGCRPISQQVIADHRPAFFDGKPDSVGDYVARGEGTCDVHGVPTRWAYFVASPGFGPVRRVGIPTSGLYVVVAVIPDSRRAHGLLHTLMHGTRFGDAGLADFAAAARTAGI